MAKDHGGFSKKASQKIKRTVLKSERQPMGRRTLPVPTPPIIVLPLRNAKVTSTITRRSPGSLSKGSGTVSLYCDNGLGTGTDELIETGVTCWSTFSKNVGVGTWVVVAIVDGMCQMIAADGCEEGS